MEVVNRTHQNILASRVSATKSNDTSLAKQQEQAQLASVISARMRVLASCVNEDGRGEYSRLNSAERRRVGAPEVTQRATEELMYEQALSHLYPTTICRSVTVCDNCAMVRDTPEAFSTREV